jgi:hypothetical protein
LFFCPFQASQLATERGIVIALDAFKPGEYFRQIHFRVGAESQNGISRGQVQVHAALQMDGACQKIPGGDHHVSAARRGAGVHRLRNGRRAIGPAVRHRAEFGDDKILRGKLRRHYPRQDFRHLRPFRSCRVQRQRQAGDQDDEGFFHDLI